MNLSILIVDDEPQVRKSIRHVLEAADHTVLEAAKGNEAMQQVRSSHIDLVITDIVMPDMEGLELIRELKKSKAHLKVIAMSTTGRTPKAAGSRRSTIWRKWHRGLLASQTYLQCVELLINKVIAKATAAAATRRSAFCFVKCAFDLSDAVSLLAPSAQLGFRPDLSYELGQLSKDYIWLFS